MENLYYTPPSDQCFEDLKSACIALWLTMGDEPRYSQEKIGRIKDIENVGDNFMYMFAMFDMNNQKIVATIISEATRLEINKRLLAGGAYETHLI